MDILEKTEFRRSEPEDRIGMLALQKRAFARDDEAELVEQLIEDDVPAISMVAELDGMIVGHVLLSELAGPDRSLALGPLGVDPQWRQFQIGSELVRRALDEARRDGWASVFVLGDPGFYQRFGFESTLADKVKSRYQGPNFQAVELVAGSLRGYDGEVRYPKSFDSH